MNVVCSMFHIIILLLRFFHFIFRAFTRPSDRSVKDVEAITSRLRRVDTLNRLPNSVLQQLAFVGYYEDLERGVMRKSYPCTMHILSSYCCRTINIITRCNIIAGIINYIYQPTGGWSMKLTALFRVKCFCPLDVGLFKKNVTCHWI